jgi:hypothetical protein
MYVNAWKKIKRKNGLNGLKFITHAYSRSNPEISSRYPHFSSYIFNYQNYLQTWLGLSPTPFYCSLSQFTSSSSAHYDLLLDMAMSTMAVPSLTVRHLARSLATGIQLMPAILRKSSLLLACVLHYIYLTRSPLQNSFTPAVVGSTADMGNQLLLQRANTVCYIGDFSFRPYHLVRIRSRRETPSIALFIAQWATFNLFTYSFVLSRN